jgi:uncharacterized protein (TIGR03000 family)
MMAPPVVTPEAKPEVKPEPKKTTEAAPATIIVNLPADATLTVDGRATTSTSARRVFVSPSLNSDREYYYELKAEFMKDGKPVTISKRINVRAGAEAVVELNAENATIVSR